MNYDFSTLDSSDFEKLSRDLLNAKFGWDLQSFKAGKDKGVDLRLSTPENNNAIVVQIKHYLKSGPKILLKDLEKNELPKVHKLVPERYIVVTSVSLNPQEKDEIVNTMFPYIASPNDILGKEDLNKYLSELPDIETKWYKLWLTSIPVMNKILHNGILGGSGFVTSKILKNIQLYVYCRSYDIALEILYKYKYILITGQPGVGKTTLAYYLTYHLLANDFQLLYIDTDISQASTLLSSDPSVKQLIFFDDFLGENYLEVNRPKTTESAFVFFLERIIASENKFLILTTRTTIYNNAIEKYEKLERMRVNEGRKEIILDEYSILDKARILYKHIFFSDIDEEHKEGIFVNKNYWEIISHKNYNPRLIEFVTQKRHLPELMSRGYFRFVLDNLDNPKEVWKYFYREQLSVEERILLHIIFLQTNTAKTSDVKMMFSRMLEFEMEYFHFRPALNPFENSLKRLLDGTLKKELNPFNRTDRIIFINPSLSDFLKYYFSQYEEERYKLLKGLSTIEQFEQYVQMFHSSGNYSSAEKNGELSMISNLLIDSADKISCYIKLKNQAIRERSIRIRIAALINGFRYLDEKTQKRIVNFCYESIIQFSIDDITTDNWSYYYSAINHDVSFTPLYNYVNESWDSIVTTLFKACSEESDFRKVKDLFGKFGQRYIDYIGDDENFQVLFELLTDLADYRTREWINDAAAGGILTYEDLDIVKQEISSSRRDIFWAFGLDDAYDEEKYFHNLDIDEIIRRNNLRIDDAKVDINKMSSNEDSKDGVNMIKEVEILYTGEYDEAFVQSKASQLIPPY